MEETVAFVASAREREKLFTELYKSTFPIVAKYISRMGGSLEEAKDVFHDALIAYYEKQLNDDSIPENEKAYLVGISKNLWTKRFQEKIRHIELPTAAETVEADSERVIPSTEKILRFLETSGLKCMELLRAFYYDKLPLVTIADRFGFSGVRSATTQKFKCLEKVRNSVKERSLDYEDFAD